MLKFDKFFRTDLTWYMAFTRLNLNDINGLKGQKQIARGIAIGNMAVIPNALKGQKLVSFALSGRHLHSSFTQGDALG